MLTTQPSSPKVPQPPDKTRIEEVEVDGEENLEVVEVLDQPDSAWYAHIVKSLSILKTCVARKSETWHLKKKQQQTIVHHTSQPQLKTKKIKIMDICRQHAFWHETPWTSSLIPAHHSI